MEPSNDTPASGVAEYFEPLGITDTLGRAVHVFRQRWKHLLLTSAIPIAVWYVIAIGIRNVFGELSASHVETRSFEMNGEEVAYQVETLRTTFSRLGLVVEFFLVCFLHVPADALNIRMVAELYAGEDAADIQNSFRQQLHLVGSKLPSLGLACAVWSTILMVPLTVLVLLMAPEGQTASHDGLSVYILPWLPKLGFGLVYFVVSSAFVLATYFTYAIITIKGGPPMTSLKESMELVKTSGLHIGAVTFLWFLVKIGITKCVSAINWWYYLHENRFWVVWDQPGIPLHPIRILWSPGNDLWGLGRSWISFSFVVFLAAMGSVLQAVLYLDTRVKQEGYSRNLLRSELGLDDSVKEATDYNSMKTNEARSDRVLA